MDEFLPVEPVRPPGPARRRLFVVVTLVVLAAFVVVAVLRGAASSSGRTGTHDRANPTPPTPARLAYVGRRRRLGVDGRGCGRPSSTPSPAPPSSSRPGRRTPRGSRRSARTAAGPASTSSRSPRAASTDDGSAPIDGLHERRSARLLPVLDAGRPGAQLPDDRARRARPAPSAGRRDGPATIVRKGAPMYWEWVDATRLLVHSGTSAATPSSARSASTARRPHRAPSTPACSAHRPSRATAGTSPSQAAADGRMASHRRVARRIVSRRSPDPRRAGVEFSPAGDTLAFVAPVETGGTVELPVGPLRPLDPSTGAVRTLLTGRS